MLKPIYENMPSELNVLPHWVCWKMTERDGKKTKPPYQPNNTFAKTDDPLTWSIFYEVQKAAHRFDGVGFVLTDNDDNVFIDFDHCRCPAFDGIDEEISGGLNMVLPEVAEHIKRLNSYTELSPTGKGIHVLLKGRLPLAGNKKGNYEVYQSGRYLTMTGHVLEGFPWTIELRQTEVDAFYKSVFGSPEKRPKQEKNPRTDTTLDGWRNLLEKAYHSQNGPAIKRLYEGDYASYPSQSEADLALCNYLSFWLDGDASAMDAAFRESGLIRDKWDEKHHRDGQTYGEATISKAIDGCHSFYGDSQAHNNSYEELFERISSTDDIGVLVKDIARDISESGLSQTEIHSLLKTIAKKTGGTIETLYSDTGVAGSNDKGSGSGNIDHLQVANDVVMAFGKENLAFVSDLRIFRQWNGRVWSELDDRSINEAILDYLGDKTHGVTKTMTDSITDLIRTRVFRKDVKWDEDTGVIPVQNGELVWNNGQWSLSAHVREHYRTTSIPVEYDPNARAPRFEEFLMEVFMGDVDIEEKCMLICEMIGYTLTTSCEYEKFILLIGIGANGKSVLLYIIMLLIGPGQVAAVQPEQLDNRFQRAHLCGKLANIVTEIKEGGEIADAALKAITSGELTTAEHKFKKPFDFKPFATCWFGTNHMPHTRDFSDALFRRALIVEFNRVFQEDEQDKQLKQKLAAELPGILNLVLTEFAGVIKRGQFTIPSSCIRAKKEWKIEADQVAQFVRDCCKVEKAASVQSGVLYAAYRNWAGEAGIQRMLNKNNFSKRVQLLGGKLRRTAQCRLIEGMRLAGLPQEGDE